MTANTPDAKQPSECSNMSEIRAGIDQIDRHIISLLGDRLGYVHEAAKFKTSEESVRALDRVERMLEDRRTWAAEEGLQPEAIRKLYADLIQYFTEHELNEWSTPR